MASQSGNYPSPTQQHASPAYGPFYGHHQQQQQQQHNAPQSVTGASQEMDQDARLRNELSRSLAPPMNRQSPPPSMVQPPSAVAPPPPPPSQVQQAPQVPQPPAQLPPAPLPQTRERDHDSDAADLQARHYNGLQHDGGLADQALNRHQDVHSSPSGQFGADGAGQKDRRSKVSRACDECRRKKARLLNDASFHVCAC